MRKKPEVSQSNDSAQVLSNEDTGVFVVKRRVKKHQPVGIRYDGNIGVSAVDSSNRDSIESLSRFSQLKHKLHSSKKEWSVSVKLPTQDQAIYRQIESLDILSAKLCELLMRCENLPEHRIDKALKQIEELVLGGADVLKPYQNGMSALSFAYNNLMGTSFYYILYNAFMQVNDINASAFVERSMRSNGEITGVLSDEAALRTYVYDCITDEINEFLDDGDTWLHRACRMADRSAIVAFIALGANHKGFNRNGVSPLALIADRAGLYNFYTNTVSQLSPFLSVEQPKKIELGVELIITPETQRKIAVQPYHGMRNLASSYDDGQGCDIAKAPSFIKDTARKSLDKSLDRSKSYDYQLSQSSSSSSKSAGGHSK